MTLIIEDRLVERVDNHPNQNFENADGEPLADFLTLHMTANENAGASAHASWMFREGGAPYSWTATVDDSTDEEGNPIIYRSFPWEARVWAAGDGRNGPGNLNSIHVECCENGSYDQFLQSLDACAQLFAHLRGLGHGRLGIVPHRHWTGKLCPGAMENPDHRFYKASHWDDFLKLCAKYEAKTSAPWLPDLPDLKPPTVAPRGDLPSKTAPKPATATAPQLSGLVDLKLGNQEGNALMAPKLQNTQRNVMKSGPEFLGSSGVAGAVGLIHSLIPDGLPVEAILALAAAVPPIIYMTRRYIRDLIKALKEMRKMVEDI
tara:strand:- start:1292 stop:2245 length:954 start_codon:yes stop_codon:yes gene_type:complete